MMASSGACERCKDRTETIEHALCGRWKAVTIWYKILPKHKFQPFMNMDWEVCLLSNHTEEELACGVGCYGIGGIRR